VKAVELALVVEHFFGRVVSVQIDWDATLGYPKGLRINLINFNNFALFQVLQGYKLKLCSFIFLLLPYLKDHFRNIPILCEGIEWSICGNCQYKWD
jgi:hypothetical protein